MRFPGPDLTAADHERLSSQYERIFAVMADAQWRSLSDIEYLTGAPAASVSAQLRHMRKPRYGSHTVERRYLGEGLYEYRLLVRQVEPKQLSLMR